MLKKYSILWVIILAGICMTLPFFWVAHIYNIAGNMAYISGDYVLATQHYKQSMNYRYSEEVAENYRWALEHLWIALGSSDEERWGEWWTEWSSVQKNTSGHSLWISDTIAEPTLEDYKNIDIYLQELQWSSNLNQVHFNKKEDTRSVLKESYKDDPLFQSIFGE